MKLFLHIKFLLTRKQLRRRSCRLGHSYDRRIPGVQYSGGGHSHLSGLDGTTACAVLRSIVCLAENTVYGLAILGFWVGPTITMLCTICSCWAFRLCFLETVYLWDSFLMRFSLRSLLFLRGSFLGIHFGCGTCFAVFHSQSQVF